MYVKHGTICYNGRTLFGLGLNAKNGNKYEKKRKMVDMQMQRKYTYYIGIPWREKNYY